MADRPTIYHNPRCSKSRAALEYLQGQQANPEVVEYLKNPPDAATVKHLLRLLNMSAREIMRSSDPTYRELKLDDARHSEEELINYIVLHPRLLERPIVTLGNAAAIGRPLDNIIDLLADND